MPRATTLYYEQLCARPVASARELFARRARLARQAQQFIVDSTSASAATTTACSRTRWRARGAGSASSMRRMRERVMAVVVRSPVARPYLEPRDWNRAA